MRSPRWRDWTRVALVRVAAAAGVVADAQRPAAAGPGRLVHGQLGATPWRAAILWTIGMSIMLVVVVALTEHFGWDIKPISV
jgi:hypothetical protein